MVDIKQKETYIESTQSAGYRVSLESISESGSQRVEDAVVKVPYIIKLKLYHIIITLIIHEFSCFILKINIILFGPQTKKKKVNF